MQKTDSRRRQRGQALVEMATFIPFLLFVTIGLIDVGKYTYYAIQVNNAARAGVQYAAQNHTTMSDTAGITAAVNADATALPSTAYHSSGYYCICANGVGGQQVCNPVPTCTGSHPLAYAYVNTQEQFPIIIKMPWLANNLTVSGYSIMRVSQ
jgi:Flp pilus assembly protein TadG